MRVIFENNKSCRLNPTSSPYGNNNFLISPEIEYFLIPKKGRRCADHFLAGLGERLEEDNIRISPEDIVNNKKFWSNKGLYVKAVYKEPFNFENHLENQLHCVFELSRLNNGYIRLIDDELMKIATDDRYLSNEFEEDKEIIAAVGECLFSDEELERIFYYAAYMYYKPN